MLGCFNNAAALASARMRGAVLGRRGVAVQQHFQRDDAAQAPLPGLVHHTHAAAAQLGE